MSAKHWIATLLAMAITAAWIWYDAASERRVGRWGLPLTILAAIVTFVVVWFIWPGLDIFFFGP